MSINDSRMAGGWKIKARTFGVMFAIIFPGAILGLLLGALGVVLAPPWTFLTSLLYLPMACLGLPILIVAGVMKWVRTRVLLVAFMGAAIVALFYLAIVGPWLPSGMTNCKAVAMAPPQVRYQCVSTSSDNTNYRYEFALEGRTGWPVMRLTR